MKERFKFDMKYRSQIENGEYFVETRDGRPAKIISFEITDSGGLPIAAQFRLYNGLPVVYLFDEDGHYNEERDSEHDLFVGPKEPELTDFENTVRDQLEEIWEGPVPVETAKRVASVLLDAARKEIGKGKDMTESALRWRKWANGACGNGEGIPIAIVKRGMNGYELVDALGIPNEEYIFLSDLEKLPHDNNNLFDWDVLSSWGNRK